MQVDIGLGASWFFQLLEKYGAFFQAVGSQHINLRLYTTAAEDEALVAAGELGGATASAVAYRLHKKRVLVDVAAALGARER